MTFTLIENLTSYDIPHKVQHEKAEKTPHFDAHLEQIRARHYRGIGTSEIK